MRLVSVEIAARSPRLRPDGQTIEHRMRGTAIFDEPTHKNPGAAGILCASAFPTPAQGFLRHRIIAIVSEDGRTIRFRLTDRQRQQ